MWKLVVWADFRFTFKLSGISFYMWLNVSAIMWNEKLKKLSIEKNRTEDEVFEFNNIQEISEEVLRSKEEWICASLPEEAAILKEQ